jgi:phage protein D
MIRRDSLAPSYAIEVNGYPIESGLSKLIISLEYESAEGIADVAKIKFANPDFILSNTAIVQPGNEVSIWLGYEPELVHVGRIKIAKKMVNWPRGDDMPTIEISGYTRDHDMMDNEPSKAKTIKPSGESKAAKKSAKKMNAKAKASEGRRFAHRRYSDAITAKALEYSFIPDVDPTPDDLHDFMQKAGLTDYQFIQGIANYTGFVFWVDGDEHGRWTLHFKDPRNLSTQEKVLEFVYNNVNASLLEFDGIAKFSGVQSKIVVEHKDPYTGFVRKVEFEQNPTTVDPVFSGTEPPDREYLKSEHLQTKGAAPSPSSILVAIDDLQVKTVADKVFRNDKELEHWARQWFRRNAQRFMFGEGLVIGEPRLMANQTHLISGLDAEFDGAWYMTRVRHLLTPDNGYTSEFSARRVIQGML